MFHHPNAEHQECISCGSDDIEHINQSIRDWKEVKGSSRRVQTEEYCECPRCEYKMLHQAGVPCFSQSCPDCKTSLIRKREGIIMPVAEMRTRYSKPLRFGDTITVETEILLPLKSSLEFHFRIYNQDRKLVSRSRTTLILADPGHRILPWPDFTMNLVPISYWLDPS